MELEKNRVRKKSFYGVLVFGHPHCSSINNTEFKVEQKNACPFPCHIGSSISSISLIEMLELPNFGHMTTSTI